MKLKAIVSAVAAFASLAAFAERDTAIYRGKMTSDLNANGNAITNLPPPSAPGDAANKGYVDQTDEAAVQEAKRYTDSHANNSTIHVTQQDKSRWDEKQDAIDDLATIREGAAKGATAVQPSAISDMETKTHAAQTYQPKGNYLTEEADPTVADWAKKPNPAPVTDLTPATNYTDTATNALDTALRGEIAAATNGIRKVDGSARPLPRYLHALDFADSYPLDAEDWYELMATNALGGCSAMRAGGRLRRNYDWTFDDAAEFVVKMSAGENRLASVGVASLGSGLTEDEVTSGKWSKKYRALPGMTLDGINERGVVAEINVDGGPTNGWHGTGANALHILAAVRWVLDHGTNAATAAASIADRIKCPTSGMNFHFMVADERETWIVENGVAHDITTNTWKVLTNFALFDAAHAGGGKERHEVITNGSIPWDAVNFTHAYEPGNDWDSDFESHEQHLEAIRQWAAQGADKEAHRGKTTAGGSPWWQTVHTSIYDFEAKTLRVAVQESADFYTFQVPVVGGEPYVPSATDPAFSNAVNAAVADYAAVSNAAMNAIVNDGYIIGLDIEGLGVNELMNTKDRDVYPYPDIYEYYAETHNNLFDGWFSLYTYTTYNNLVLTIKGKLQGEIDVNVENALAGRSIGLDDLLQMDDYEFVMTIPGLGDFTTHLIPRRAYYGNAYSKAWTDQNLAQKTQLNDYYTKTETDTKYSTKEEGQQVRAIVYSWEQFLDGSNVVFAITNFISGTYSLDHAKLEIRELRDGEYHTVYESRTEITNHTEAAKREMFGVINSTAEVIRAEIATKGDAAWGRRSSTGQEVPISNTVWVTEQNLRIAGGMEYERVAVGEGAIYVLTAKGQTPYMQGDEGALMLKDDGGTNYFGMVRSDSYTIGCNTDDIRIDNNLVYLDYLVTMSDHPVIWYMPSLENYDEAGWEQLNYPDGSPVPGASHQVYWDESPRLGAQECYINVGDEPKGFFRATIEVAGDCRFRTNMSAEIPSFWCTDDPTKKVKIIWDNGTPKLVEAE